jgi:hypothetical protein
LELLKKKKIPNNSETSLSAQAADLKIVSIEIILLQLDPVIFFSSIKTTNQTENTGTLKM